MEEIINVIPKKGFGNLNFGMSFNEANSILKEEGILNLDYKDGRKYYDYKNGSLSLLFRDKYGLIVISIENDCDQNNIYIWDYLLFSLTEKSLINIIKEKKLTFYRDDSQDLFGDFFTIEVIYEGLSFTFDNNTIVSLDIHDCSDSLIIEQIKTQIQHFEKNKNL